MNATFALTPAQRRRFLEMNPREQVLTKTDLAKSENAWRELPHIVSRGAQKNFSAFADYVAEGWSSRRTSTRTTSRAAWPSHPVSIAPNLVSAQPWYSGGYRANVVSYAMSKLAQMIGLQEPNDTLDAKVIWSKGAISQALRDQLVVVAKAMHDVITDPPPGTRT